jgi:hypothetical protein
MPRPTDKIPIALHAANETGMYSDAAIAQLAKYDMVTIEKSVRPPHPQPCQPASLAAAAGWATD